MHLNEYVSWIFDAMEAKGFHEKFKATGDNETIVRLAYVTTEISEAVQEVKRHGLDDNAARRRFAEEIADTFIRLFDLVGCVGFDLEYAIADKMQKNMARPHKYGTPEEVKT